MPRLENLLKQIMFLRLQNRLGAVVDLEFAVNPLDVSLERVLRDVKALSNLGIGVSPCQMADDFPLTRAKVNGRFLDCSLGHLSNP